MKLTAVIFDLDGTVLDNEVVYCRSFEDVLKKYKVDYGASCPHVRGIGLEENWKFIREKYSDLKKVSLNQLVHETQDAYHARLPEIFVQPGFFELQSELADEGIRVALATSNDWWLVEDELIDLDLHKYFETVVTGDEVVNRKPAPDIFLETARKLGVESEGCVVIEDSKAGVEAAKEAGMIAVGITSTADEDFKKADLVVSGFEEITPEVLEGLFRD